MSDSPLSEAKPDSLMELLNRDPLKLTRSDRDEIVRLERADRLRFAQSEAAGERPAKVAKAPKQKVDISALKASLGL